MLIALLADIHANREALTACLADAERAGAERYVVLGDLVGYGADPTWVVERVAEMVAKEPETMKDITKEQPIGRLGRPEEIGSAVLWLCSDGASFVIGHALAVDGGYTAR